jgi:hypothetical protein
LSLLRTFNLVKHDVPDYDLPGRGRLRHGVPAPPQGQATTRRFHLAVTGTAVVLAAALAGSAGAVPVIGAAPPASSARPASVLGQAGQPGTGPAAAAARQAGLDAYVTTAGGRTGARPEARVAKRRKAVRMTPRHIARLLLHRFHWRQRQFRYLNLLWSRESSWNIHAFNAYSGAYGIPQADPGAKMASAGPRWRTSAHTQILWGLRYIKVRYRSPEGAWNHELSVGWY